MGYILDRIIKKINESSLYHLFTICTERRSWAVLNSNGTTNQSHSGGEDGCSVPREGSGETNSSGSTYGARVIRLKIAGGSTSSNCQDLRTHTESEIVDRSSRVWLDLARQIFYGGGHHQSLHLGSFSWILTQPSITHVELFEHIAPKISRTNHEFQLKQNTFPIFERFYPILANKISEPR